MKYILGKKHEEFCMESLDFIKKACRLLSPFLLYERLDVKAWAFLWKKRGEIVEN